MFVEFDWPDYSFHNEFSVSYYGAADSKFSRDEAQLFDRDELLAQLMESCATQGLIMD